MFEETGGVGVNHLILKDQVAFELGGSRIQEWGLANSVWYSNNVSPEQKHIVRIHLQRSK